MLQESSASSTSLGPIFHESLVDRKDDDWAFLRQQLEAVLAQMRSHFCESYEEHVQSQSCNPPSPPHVAAASRDQAVASLVVEATAAIMSAMRTATAVNMIQQYRARVQVMLKREVEDAFSCCAGHRR